MFFGKNDAKAETPVLWPPHAKSWLIGKDSDAGRDWGQEEKGTTGWDGWMASPTRWTWVWVKSGSWWWTGRPGVLRFMELQRVRHNWATELYGIELSPWLTHYLYVGCFQNQTHHKNYFLKKILTLLVDTFSMVRCMSIQTPFLWASIPSWICS